MMNSGVSDPGGAELVPRHWVLERLEAWLGTDGPPVFLVTGAPGTGKTVLAAQVARLRDSVPRAADYPLLSAATIVLGHFCDSRDDRTLDPLDFVSALSTGLAATVPGFATALAGTAAGTPVVLTINSSLAVDSVEAGGTVTNVRISVPRDIPARRAFAYLVRRPLEAATADGWDRDLLVVVDDVSGAYAFDPDDNIGRLIGLVAGGVDLPGRLRFVVTSRADPWMLRALPPPAVDLTADRPAEADDLRAYVGRRLAGLDPPLRAAWTDRVTDSADGNFLYARHALDHLLADDDAVRGGPTAAELPADLVALYRTWFRTGLARHRDLWWNCVQPVLSALTAALGAGLTGKQLAGITGLPTSRTRQALDECGQYLTGELPDGPFRIYHDSFREYLTEEEVPVEEGDRAVASYFVGRHGDDWLAADDYACRHLATHLALVGELVPHLARPDFLVVAAPSALLHHLSQLDDDAGRGAEIYRRTGWLLADRDHGERAAYLELAAHELGDRSFVDGFARLPLHRGWAAHWVSLVRHRPGRIVGAHPPGVLDLRIWPYDDGWVIAATVARDGVRLWDLDTNTVIAAIPWPLPGPAIGLAWVGDTRLVVAGPHGLLFIEAGRGPVGTVAARTGTLITAVAVADVDDRAVLVLGHHDGSLQAADAMTGEPVGDPVQAHVGPVTALDAGDGIVVSAGADGDVALWDLEAGGVIEMFRRLALGPEWAGSCIFVSTDDEWALVGGASDGVIGVLRHRHRDGHEEVLSRDEHEPAAWQYGFHAVDGSSNFFSVNETTNSGVVTYDQVVRRLRAAEEADRDDERPTRGPLTIVRLAGGVNSLDAMVDDDCFVLGSGGQDGQVNLYRLEGADAWTGENLVPFGDPVSAVRFTALYGRVMLVAADSGPGGTIRTWPLRQGPDPLPAPVGDLTAAITHICGVTAPDDRPLIVTVSDDRSVTLRDARSGAVEAGPWECPDVVVTGVHADRWDDLLVVAVHGFTRAGPAKDAGTDDQYGVIKVFLLRADVCIESHDLRVADLRSVLAVVGVGPGEILAVGSAHEDRTTMWRLSRQPDGWSQEPLIPRPVGIATRGADLMLHWATVVPGSGGRQVLVGGQQEWLHVVDLDRTTVDRRWVFAAAVCAAVYDGRPSALVADGTVAQGTSVYVDHLDSHFPNRADPAFRGPAGGQIVVVAATPDADVVVAGSDDGRLLVWTGAGPPERIIRIAAAARRLVMCGADTVAVLTDLGLYSVRIR